MCSLKISLSRYDTASHSAFTDGPLGVSSVAQLKHALKTEVIAPMDGRRKDHASLRRMLHDLTQEQEEQALRELAIAGLEKKGARNLISRSRTRARSGSDSVSEETPRRKSSLKAVRALKMKVTKGASRIRAKSRDVNDAELVKLSNESKVCLL